MRWIQDKVIEFTSLIFSLLNLCNFLHWQWDYNIYFFVSSCFYFSRVKLSNLLMVVVEHKVKENPSPMGAEPRQINYTSNFPCHKTELNRLDHRRLEDCFTQDCRVSDLFKTLMKKLTWWLTMSWCCFMCKKMFQRLISAVSI